LIPNPIRKVLSSIRTHRVHALLIGGQACVFYGAAEFSRDTDLILLAEAANLSRLRQALAELQAEVIAVPPFQIEYLRRGHVLHFRCHHPEASGIRIDVMSRMRGVDTFAKLWSRRTTLSLPDGFSCDLVGLPDLVQTKKTQPDKDWPMLRRLLEVHYFENRAAAAPAQVCFWFRELRSPALLVELAGAQCATCRRMAKRRPLLIHAMSGNPAALEQALAQEELEERAQDRLYWLPLREELERLRHRHRQ
jgi:hypothetical protein